MFIFLIPTYLIVARVLAVIIFLLFFSNLGLVKRLSRKLDISVIVITFLFCAIIAAVVVVVKNYPLIETPQKKPEPERHSNSEIKIKNEPETPKEQKPSEIIVNEIEADLKKVYLNPAGKTAPAGPPAPAGVTDPWGDVWTGSFIVLVPAEGWSNLIQINPGTEYRAWPSGHVLVRRGDGSTFEDGPPPFHTNSGSSTANYKRWYLSLTGEKEEVTIYWKKI